MRCAVERDLEIYLRDQEEQELFEETVTERFWEAHDVKLLLRESEKYRPFLQDHLDRYFRKGFYDEDIVTEVYEMITEAYNDEALETNLEEKT